MQTFMNWMENRIMKLGGILPYNIKHEIMALSRNTNYTGKDITNILQKNGYEVTYPQVMSVLTPIFGQRKTDNRLEKLGVQQNLPMPMGVTGPQYKSTYIKPSVFEEPNEGPEHYHDPYNPSYSPARSGLNVSKTDSRRVLRKPFEM